MVILAESPLTRREWLLWRVYSVWYLKMSSDCEVLLKEGSFIAESELDDSELCSAEDMLAREVWQQRRASIVDVNNTGYDASGFVIDQSLVPGLESSSVEVFVLTTAHVVRGGAFLFVGPYTDEGELPRLYPAEIIASDDSKDLALLKVRLDKDNDGKIDFDLSGVRKGDVAKGYAGETVLTALTQLNRSPALFRVERASHRLAEHKGLQSSFPDVTIADDTRVVTLSAPVEPGTSGAPVFDLTGSLMGIVSLRLPDANVLAAGERIAEPDWRQTVLIDASEILRFLESAK